MKKLEQDIEFLWGNRINWYMLFFAIVIGDAAKKHGWMSKKEADELMVDQIFTKFFGLYIYDRDVDPNQYANSNIKAYKRKNLSGL